MATKTITTRIELDGAPAYTQAVKDCKAELKLLNSEQKLIEARFKATGDQEQYAADMTELLQKKIEAQKKVVEAAREAIQELTEKGGENTTQMDEWKIKLNNAETSLTNLNTQLTKVSTGSGTLKTKTEDATEALKEHKDAAEDASEALESMDAKESGLIKTLDSWSASLDGFTGAMDFTALNHSLENLKKVFGEDNEAINSLQNVTSVLTTLKEGAEGALGVVRTLLTNPTAAATAGAVLAVVAVRELVTALDEAARERDFGWTSQLTNLNAGIGTEGKNAIRDGIRDSIADGIKAADVQGSIDSEISNGYKQAAYNLVTGSAGQFATDRERGVALAYVGDTYKQSVTAAEDQYRDALIAYDQAVQAAGDDAAAQAEAENALAEALERKNAALTEANRLRTEQLGQLLGSTGDLTAMADTLERVGALGSAMNFMQEGDGIYNFETGKFVEQFSQMLTQAGFNPEDLEGLDFMTIMEKLNGELKSAMTDADAMIGDNSPLLAYFQAMLNNGDIKGLDYSTASDELLTAMRAQMLLDAAGDDGKLDMSELLTVVSSDDYRHLGAEAGSGLAEGFKESSGEAVSAAEQMALDTEEAVKTALDEHSPSKKMRVLGENAAVGLAEGIYARGGDAAAAARWLASLVTNTVRSNLKIQSPSKVFEDIGQMTAAGFAEGIEGSYAMIEDAVSSMVGAVTRRPEALARSGAAGAYSSAPEALGRAARPDTVHVTLKLDEEVLGDVMAPIVDGKIGAKIKATRR